MNALRRSATALLWLCAAVGVLCGLVWAATAVGVIQPLVVISGSMEPGIMTGDLVVDTRTDVATLRPGDVVSLPSTLTENLVTHRIESIEGTGSERTIVLKGDANAEHDALPYQVSGQVWHPVAQFGGLGTVITRMTTPAVVVPLLIGLLALLALTMLSSPAAPAQTTPTTPSGRTAPTGRRRAGREITEHTP